MKVLLLAVLAIPLAETARAAGAALQLDASRNASAMGAGAAPVESAADAAASAFEGGPAAAGAVSGSTQFHRGNLYAAPGLAQSGPIAPPSPQLPASEESKHKLPKWAMYAAGGGLGFLQGALFGGPFAALAGAAVGLAATHMYLKDDPGAAIGISAGSIVGTFLGGPIGGLIGAVVGGLIGHFLTKLF